MSARPNRASEWPTRYSTPQLTVILHRSLCTFIYLYTYIYISEQRTQQNFNKALRASTSAAPQLTPQITVIMLTYNYLSKHVTLNNFGYTHIFRVRL